MLTLPITRKYVEESSIDTGVSYSDTVGFSRNRDVVALVLNSQYVGLLLYRIVDLQQLSPIFFLSS